MTEQFKSKDTLAKLLATEDLTVVKKNVATASFDLISRTLTLPNWKDMTEDQNDHLTGHEVGHALFTPPEGWKNEIAGKTKGYKSYLNVIEDARIEKLMLRRYPGLRRNFIRSYNKMLDDGFFGKSRTSINSYDLIDRLNVAFKCGQSAGVTFSEEENMWVAEIEAAESWENVVDIADRLFQKAKDDAEKENEAEENEFDPDAMTDGYDDSNYEEGEDGDDYEEDQDDPMVDETSGSNDDDEDSSDMGEDAGEENELDRNKGGDYWEPNSKTDELLAQNIEETFGNDSTTEIFNMKLDDIDVDQFMTSYKDIIKSFDSFYSEPEQMVAVGKDLLKKFRLNNKPTINYLVKEFEMKKRATEYARTTTAKTGVIDPVKMNNYRYSDDIFKKMTITPEGKNHGLLMYIDFSGSMAADFNATMEQTLNLVMFCRQVNISFRVYGFTSDRYENDKIVSSENTEDMLLINRNLTLLELFNNKMSRSDFVRMSEICLTTGLAYAERYGDDRHNSPVRIEEGLPKILLLGGTPLDATIVAAISIFKEFKKSNNLDIVNTVFLTDGDSHHMEAQYDGEKQYSACRYGRYKYNIIDRDTKKTYVISEGERFTNTLLLILRENTQSNVIGYRIMPKNKRTGRRSVGYSIGYSEFDKMWTKLRKDKFVSIPNSGYSEYFGIFGGADLNTANTNIEVASDAKKSAIRSAFRKANTKRKESRLMLSKFISLVA